MYHPIFSYVLAYYLTIQFIVATTRAQASLCAVTSSADCTTSIATTVVDGSQSSPASTSMKSNAGWEDMKRFVSFDPSSNSISPTMTNSGQGDPTPTLECMLDPNNSSSRFSIGNANFVPYIGRGSYISPLLNADFAGDTLDSLMAYRTPLYHFESAPNASPDLYDLILDGPNGTTGYVGVTYEDGVYYAITSDVSSKGGNPVQDSSGRWVMTTIFLLSCEGQIGISNESTSWMISQSSPNRTVFSNFVGARSKEENTWIIPEAFQDWQYNGSYANSSLSRRDSPSQSGAIPRCPSKPPGLKSVPKRGISHPAHVGCAVIGLPNLNFGTCCDELNENMSNCKKSFEDCNNEFAKCLDGLCQSSLWDKVFDFVGTSGCILSAGYYKWMAQRLGTDAFKKSNDAYCKCVCPDGSNLCHGQCPDYSQDNDNCGHCDHKCKGRRYCSASKCVLDPPSSTGGPSPTSDQSSMSASVTRTWTNTKRALAKPTLYVQQWGR